MTEALRVYWRRARLTAATVGLVGTAAIVIVFLVDPAESATIAALVRFASGTILLYGLVPGVLASIMHTAIVRLLKIRKTARPILASAVIGGVLGAAAGFCVSLVLPWDDLAVTGFGSGLSALSAVLSEITGPDEALNEGQSPEEAKLGESGILRDDRRGITEG